MIKTFEFLINTGVSAVEGIVDSKERATVCAELAKAIAMSGILRGDVAEEAVETEPKKETATKSKSKGKGKASSKKEALKTENQKEETVTPMPEETVAEEPQVPEEPQTPVAEEPIAEEPAPVEEEPVATAPTQEVEIVDEWTDEMCTVKAEQLEILNSYVEAWGAEYVYNDCLGCFSEGTFTGAENVRPSNIDGFVVYLNELAQQFAQQ